METADEQVRVSARVKRMLDRQRREGESYNDVLERVLDGIDALVAAVGRTLDAPAVSSDSDLTHEATREVIAVVDCQA